MHALPVPPCFVHVPSGRVIFVFHHYWATSESDIHNYLLWHRGGRKGYMLGLRYYHGIILMLDGLSSATIHRHNIKDPLPSLSIRVHTHLQWVCNCHLFPCSICEHPPQHSHPPTLHSHAHHLHFLSLPSPHHPHLNILPPNQNKLHSHFLNPSRSLTTTPLPPTSTYIILQRGQCLVGGTRPQMGGPYLSTWGTSHTST